MLKDTDNHYSEYMRVYNKGLFGWNILIPICMILNRVDMLCWVWYILFHDI